MRILGIETSCDETAAAVVDDGLRLLSNVVASSLDLHIPFGGVVPEIAARSHIELILPTIAETLRQAKTSWNQIDAIAVTQGPGLLGSLLVGVLTARTLAIAKNKPLYAVNHVEAHVYGAFIRDTSLPSYVLPAHGPKFPLLTLIISGGHTQLVLFKDHFKYQVLGRTTDDAVGEAFDKVAKILGLPYPGGPSIAKKAKAGHPEKIRLPVAKMEKADDFSFSGLKTAVLRTAQAQSGHGYDFPSTKLPKALKESQKANIAAAFQATAVKDLIEHLKSAEKKFQPKSIVIAGGVAANQALRKSASEQLSTPVIFPHIKLCTDNAAMIAAHGYYQAKYKRPTAGPYSLQPDPSLKMK